MSPKLMLLLFGALLLICTTCDLVNAHSSPVTTAEKHQIIRNMLEAQKDIRHALMKIQRQIEGDLNSTGHNGEADDDSDEEDSDEELGGDQYGGMSGEEEMEYFKDRQKKIREVREKLESTVKSIAGSLIAIKEYIEKIDKKVDEAIQSSHKKKYDLIYHSKPGHHHDSGERPKHSSGGGPTISKPSSQNVVDRLSFKDPLGLTLTATAKPAEDEPFQPIVGTGLGKRNKKPSRTYRTKKSLDGTIPTVDTEHLSSPDIPSIVGYEGPVQKAVEFQHNQQQVE